MSAARASRPWGESHRRGPFRGRNVMAKERGHQTDEDLKRLVSDALFIDPKVTIGSEIVVLVEDGEVTLRGSVGTFGDKREANKAASRVDGVQSVKDELKVFGLTDSDLRRD